MDYFKVIVENLLPVIAAIVVPILILLARGALRAAQKKWDFQVSDANEKRLMDLIEASIGFAEEKAMQAVKTDPEKLPSGAKKLDTALEFAVAQAQQMGFDDMARDFLSNLIESKLFKMRKDGDVPETLKTETIKTY